MSVQRLRRFMIILSAHYMYLVIINKYLCSCNRKIHNSIYFEENKNFIKNMSWKLVCKLVLSNIFFILYHLKFVLFYDLHLEPIRRNVPSKSGAA